MYKTQELQDILGLSRRQLRTRLDTLARVGLLDGQERSGPHNRKEYSVAVLDMLRELDALYRLGGQPLPNCAQELSDRIRNGGHDGNNGQGQPEGNRVQPAGQLAPLVEQLQRENAWLRSQVERLTALLEEAQRPALASRTSWWARLLGR